MKVPRLNTWVSGLWQRLGLRKKVSLIRAVLWFLSLPGVKHIYRPVVKRKASWRLPHMLIIESSGICNLKCVMCAYSEVSARQKMIMPMDIFRKVIDDASDFAIGHVSLNGLGEPLIDDTIFEKILYAKARNMYVEFFTNATLLDREKAEKILESDLDHIVFSFDAADKETYESIRVGAQWEQVVSNIQQFLELKESKQVKLSIEVIWLIQKKNLNVADVTGKALERLFPGARIVSTFASNWRPEEQVHEELNTYPTGDNRICYPCRRLYAPLVLCDGTVTPCCMDVWGEVSLGNIANSSIKEIWESEASEKIRAYHLEGQGDKVSICSSCYELSHSGLRWLI